MEVTWDEAKNLANRKRHGVSFEDAAALFTSGADYLEIYDEPHSDLEERFRHRAHREGARTRGLDGAG